MGFLWSILRLCTDVVDILLLGKENDAWKGGAKNQQCVAVVVLIKFCCVFLVFVCFPSFFEFFFLLFVCLFPSGSHIQQT